MTYREQDLELVVLAQTTPVDHMLSDGERVVDETAAIAGPYIVDRRIEPADDLSTKYQYKRRNTIAYEAECMNSDATRE